MKWKTFKEEKPYYGQPIFVYKEKTGVFNYFKKDDDVRSCIYTRRSETVHGWIYYLEGYSYGSEEVAFREKEFELMKWISIPKPD